jgi:hypothetical protein
MSDPTQALNALSSPPSPGVSVACQNLFTRFIPLSLLGFGILICTGCGKQVASVSGTVTFKGEPLKAGNVTFYSTDGTYSQGGAIGQDGTYTIPSLYTGDYKVCVETDSVKPSTKFQPPPPNNAKSKTDAGTKVKENLPEVVPPEGAHKSDPMGGMKAKQKANYTEIPKNYSKPADSGLTFTISGGSNTYNIELK